ncbi:acyl-CoA thioesterase [Cellulosilyticum sp. I15G10I2]|uniref:acyl-CoA thioesterase n=1 Tax=Cellulosilyticum sp. I15G10I2 TaxID=1892843 RepID=UPI00085C2F6F|nr:hotdog domain-containing protein [Cellulosilyticum sp. I15G10I2]
MKESKRVEDTIAEQAYLIMHKHINGYGRLFGGQLMQWIDSMAAIIGKRYAQTEVTTAAIDNLNFRGGAYLNDTVVLIGRVTYVGNTSIEVRVDTYVEALDETRKMINRAYIVMVAIDQNEQPVQVPRLIFETEAQKAEWAGGKRRYDLRKERRREGF